MVNANIVLDGNRHREHQRRRLRRLATRAGSRSPGGPGRVRRGTIKNSVIGPGGDADGMQISANGVQVLGNEFVGIKQISEVHTDSLQLYGATNTVIRGNYFHDFDVAIMAPDGGEQRADHRQRVHPRRAGIDRRSSSAATAAPCSRTT